MISLNQVFKPRIFRHTSLKNFLTKTLAEMNPELSFSSKSIDYFAETFLRFIFDKAVFDYWRIKNNYQDYLGWPEPLKMDHFMESAWDQHAFDH